MVPGPERPKKDVRSRNRVVEGAGVGFERVALFLFVEFRPARVHDTLAVAHRNVPLRDAKFAQEVEAGDCRGAGA